MLQHSQTMPETPVAVDYASRFTTQYNLAVKNYLHRNFNKSFKLIHPLIDELKITPHLITTELRVKIAKIYFSLISLLLNEITNVKLLKLTIPNQSINFPDYLSHADSILQDFNNNALFKLVHDLKLTYNGEVMLACLLTESTNKLKPQNLQNQVESYLTLQGLYPGPINETMMKNNGTSLANNEKILEFYLSEVLLKNLGLDETKEIVQRLFVIDDVSVNKWVQWVDTYNDKVHMRSFELPEEVSRDEDNEDDEDDVIYESYYEDEHEHEDQGYTSAETVTANTTANNNSYLSARTLSGQTDATHTTLVEEKTKSKTKKSKSSKSKKSKSLSKKTRTHEETKESPLPITYMSKQLALLKRFSADYIQKYPIFKVIVVLVLLLLTLPRSNVLRAREKLASAYGKMVKTVQLAFKVSFM